MTDIPAVPTPAPAAPQPASAPRASVSKTGPRVTDPGDASPLGHPEGSDFVPRPQETHPLTVVLPGTGAPT